eukprot:TRINITY_DN5770_c0_g1_i4.p1 TRINITY_DN5770_c0_g1~~TRINITY_DN5770_c0_g1_i4.p1  ORF type:complete len:107 (-),score=44.38 TRINITY_DN5770_c0_g1_i4:120-404(-)
MTQHEVKQAADLDAITDFHEGRSLTSDVTSFAMDLAQRGGASAGAQQAAAAQVDDGDVTAVVALFDDVDRPTARRVLAKHHGNVLEALKELVHS